MAVSCLSPFQPRGVRRKQKIPVTTKQHTVFLWRDCSNGLFFLVLFFSSSLFAVFFLLCLLLPLLVCFTYSPLHFLFFLTYFSASGLPDTSRVMKGVSEREKDTQYLLSGTTPDEIDLGFMGRLYFKRRIKDCHSLIILTAINMFTCAPPSVPNILDVVASNAKPSSLVLSYQFTRKLTAGPFFPEMA